MTKKKYRRLVLSPWLAPIEVEQGLANCYAAFDAGQIDRQEVSDTDDAAVAIIEIVVRILSN